MNNKNAIDIKIREFALYLKDFGLLNETNIKDFLNTFLNISGNEQISSNDFKNDINLELIYLKENLSKTMFEFFNLMTEERKRITYLNMYSKFLQKREKDLTNKGHFLYKIYCSEKIKGHFQKWKAQNSNFNINKQKKNEEINSFKNLQTDNFCFNIISENNIEKMNNNLIFNSNNHKIIFKNNSNPKSENLSSIGSYTDINSLILSTKSTVFNNNNNIILNSNNFKNKLFQDNKSSKNYKYQTLENDKKNIIYENYETQKKERKKQNIKEIKSQATKSSNKSLSVKNYNKTIKNDDNSRKTKRKFIKLIEKEKLTSKGNNIQTMRKTYNSNRPISYFDYEEYNKKNVYKRLYEQNIEYNKRKEQRIEENIKEIKERSNHPIIKNNSFNKYNKLKKNFQNNENIKNNFMNRNKISLLEKQKKIKNNFKSFENDDKEYRYSDFDKKNEAKNDKEKKKKGKDFMENQKLCIKLYEELIKDEEQKRGKKFDENEKEKLFKELLNKIYKENIGNKIQKDNISEDKINEENLNVNETTKCEN